MSAVAGQGRCEKKGKEERCDMTTQVSRSSRDEDLAYPAKEFRFYLEYNQWRFIKD